MLYRFVLNEKNQTILQQKLNWWNIKWMDVDDIVSNVQHNQTFEETLSPMIEAEIRSNRISIKQNHPELLVRGMADVLDKILKSKPYMFNCELSTEIKRWLGSIDHIVECNNNEYHQAWLNYSNKSPNKTDKTIHEWSSSNDGYLPTIGYVGASPVCISLRISTITGKRVLFWYATSDMVNYPLIYKWFEITIPNIRRIDIGNVHNILM